MYSFGEELVIEGDIAAVWQAATDVAAWPTWDPHEEKARLDGPFAPGTKGWNKPRGAPAGSFTITGVEPERMWEKAMRRIGADPAGLHTLRVH